MMKINEQKFDIIILAGQSNAEGNGVSFDDFVQIRNDVFELVDANQCYLDENQLVHYTYPTVCKIQCLQERISEWGDCRSDLSFSFVDSYIKKGLLDKDRKILVIKAFVGASGFALKQQGVNNPLGIRTKDMVNYALSLNKDNRIVAYLWHQGEADACEFPELSVETRYKNYHDAFMAQTIDLLNTYSQFRFPIISGEFVREWADSKEFSVRAHTIETCLRDCMKEIGYAEMVTTENLTSNNYFLHNGDNIHFSKEALVELGKRYFDAYYRAVKNNL